MKLNIQNYEILNFPSDNLVISERGISRISSPPLLEALTKLKHYDNITKLKLNEILSEHGLNPESAYNFLERVLAIREAVDNTYFEKTIVVHEWSGKIDLEQLLRSEINTPLELHKISDSLKDIISNKKYYIVILCTHYNYDIMKEIYFDLADAAPESAISICHNAGNAYCISQPYLPKIGNPCHFCSIDRLVNYENHQDSKNTWSKLLKFCRNRHMAIPTTPLSFLQESMVVGALIQKIKLMTHTNGGHRYQDNILQATYIDLNDGAITDVSASHWHMCDCLRSQK